RALRHVFTLAWPPVGVNLTPERRSRPPEEAEYTPGGGSNGLRGTNAGSPARPGRAAHRPARGLPRRRHAIPAWVCPAPRRAPVLPARGLGWRGARGAFVERRRGRPAGIAAAVFVHGRRRARRSPCR